MHLPSNKDLDRAVGELLRTRRERLGKSIDLVAHDCDMTSEELESLEKGETEIVITILVKLGKYYKIPIEDFYTLAAEHGFTMFPKKE